MSRKSRLPLIWMPLALAGAALAGCATTQPTAAAAQTPAVQGHNERPPLRHVPLAGSISFAYKVYGDPGAAPSQAFDDGRYLYLQFKAEEPPPIPMTRDGRLLEYEVMQGGLIKTARVDSVVLRLGPRAAFVDRADLEIVALSGSANTSAAGVALPAQAAAAAAPALKVEPPPQPAQPAPGPRKEEAKAREAEQVQRLTLRLSDGALPEQALEPGLWRLCHAPTVRDFAAAQALRERLQRAQDGVRVALTDACQTPGQAVLERLAQTR